MSDNQGLAGKLREFMTGRFSEDPYSGPESQVTRSDIFPMRVEKKPGDDMGELFFDPGAGIIGEMVRAAGTPKRVLEGEYGYDIGARNPELFKDAGLMALEFTGAGLAIPKPKGALGMSGGSRILGPDSPVSDLSVPETITSWVVSPSKTGRENVVNRLAQDPSVKTRSLSALDDMGYGDTVPVFRMLNTKSETLQGEQLISGTVKPEQLAANTDFMTQGKIDPFTEGGTDFILVRYDVPRDKVQAYLPAFKGDIEKGVNKKVKERGFGQDEIPGVEKVEDPSGHAKKLLDLQDEILVDVTDLEPTVLLNSSGQPVNPLDKSMWSQVAGGQAKTAEDFSAQMSPNQFVLDPTAAIRGDVSKAEFETAEAAARIQEFDAFNNFFRPSRNALRTDPMSGGVASESEVLIRTPAPPPSQVPTKAELNDLGRQIKEAKSEGDTVRANELQALREQKQKLFEDAKAARAAEQPVKAEEPKVLPTEQLISGRTNNLVRYHDRNGRMVDDDGYPLPDQAFDSVTAVVSPVSRGLAELDVSLSGRSLTGNEFLKEIRKQPGVTDTKLEQSGIMREAQKAGDSEFFVSTGGTPSLNSSQGIETLLKTVETKSPIRGSIINKQPRWGEMQYTQYGGDLSYGYTHQMEPDRSIPVIETVHTLDFPDMPADVKARNKSHQGLGGTSEHNVVGHSRENIVRVVNVDDPNKFADDIGERYADGFEDQGDQAGEYYEALRQDKGVSPQQLERTKKKSAEDFEAAQTLFADRMLNAVNDLPIPLNRVLDANLNGLATDLGRRDAFDKGETFTPATYKPSREIREASKDILLQAGMNALRVSKVTEGPSGSGRKALQNFFDSDLYVPRSVDGSLLEKTNTTLEDELQKPEFWSAFIKDGGMDRREFMREIVPADRSTPFMLKFPSLASSSGDLQAQLNNAFSDGRILSEMFKEERSIRVIPEFSPLTQMQEAFNDYTIARDKNDATQLSFARMPIEQRAITRKSLDEYNDNKALLDDYFTKKSEYAALKKESLDAEEGLSNAVQSVFDNPRVSKKAAELLRQVARRSKADWKFYARAFEGDESENYRVLQNVFTSIGSLPPFSKVLSQEFGMVPDYEKIGQDFGYKYTPDETVFYDANEAIRTGKAVYELQRLLQKQLRDSGVSITQMKDSFQKAQQARETIKPLEGKLDEAAFELRDRLLSAEDKEGLGVHGSGTIEQRKAEIEAQDKLYAEYFGKNFNTSKFDQKEAQKLAAKKVELLSNLSEDIASASGHLDRRFAGLAGIDKNYSKSFVALPYEKSSDMTAEFTQTRLSNHLAGNSWIHAYDPDTGELPSFDELIGKGDDSILHGVVQQHQGKLAKARQGQVKGVEGFRAYNSGFMRGAKEFMKNNPGVFEMDRFSTNADIEPSLIKKKKAGKNADGTDKFVDAENYEEFDVRLRYTPEFREGLARLMKEVEASTPMSANPSNRIQRMQKEVQRRLPEITRTGHNGGPVIQSFAKGGMVYKGIGSMGREVL